MVFNVNDYIWSIFRRVLIFTFSSIKCVLNDPFDIVISLGDPVEHAKQSGSICIGWLEENKRSYERDSSRPNLFTDH